MNQQVLLALAMLIVGPLGLGRCSTTLINPSVLPFPIYWINLDHRVDRRTHMEQLLRGQNHTRISALSKPTLEKMVAAGQLKLPTPLTDAPGVGEGYVFSTYSYSEMGCTLSHLTAIRRALLEGHRYALVLEDDLALASPNATWRTTVCSLLGLIRSAPKDWHIIQLLTSAPIVQDKLTTESRLLVPRRELGREVWGAICYLISYKGMQRLMSMVWRRGRFDLPAGHMLLADYFLYEHVSTYVTPVATFGAPEDVVESTINSEGELAWRRQKNIYLDGCIRSYTKRNWQPCGKLCQMLCYDLYAEVWRRLQLRLPVALNPRAARYALVPSGTCPSNGYQWITSREECNAASFELLLAGAPIKPEDSNENRVMWCSVWEPHAGQWVHWNNQTTGSIGGSEVPTECRAENPCICKPGLAKFHNGN